MLTINNSLKWRYNHLKKHVRNGLKLKFQNLILNSIIKKYRIIKTFIDIIIQTLDLIFSKKKEEKKFRKDK